MKYAYLIVGFILLVFIIGYMFYVRNQMINGNGIRFHMEGAEYTEDGKIILKGNPKHFPEWWGTINMEDK